MGNPLGVANPWQSKPNIVGLQGWCFKCFNKFLTLTFIKNDKHIHFKLQMFSYHTNCIIGRIYHARMRLAISTYVKLKVLVNCDLVIEQNILKIFLLPVNHKETNNKLANDKFYGLF